VVAVPEDTEWIVGLSSVCSILAKVVPRPDLDALTRLIGKRSGDHIIIDSDDTEAPELSLELILFEVTPDFLHARIALSKEGTASVLFPNVHVGDSPAFASA